MTTFEIKIEVNGKHSKLEIKNLTPVPFKDSYFKDLKKVTQLLEAMALGLKAQER
jgi:hypothetical protein